LAACGGLVGFTQGADHRPKPREVCTIYEIDATGQGTGRQRSTIFAGRRRPTRSASCTRPSTIRRAVDHKTVRRTRHPENVRIPIRPHFGVMGVAPKEGLRRFGSRGIFWRHMDNWRVGGATMYYPSRFRRAVLDRRLLMPRRAIPSCAARDRVSLTGSSQLIVHKRNFGRHVAR